MTEQEEEYAVEAVIGDATKFAMATIWAYVRSPAVTCILQSQVSCFGSFPQI